MILKQQIHQIFKENLKLFRLKILQKRTTN